MYDKVLLIESRVVDRLLRLGLLISAFTLGIASAYDMKASAS